MSEKEVWEAAMKHFAAMPDRAHTKWPNDRNNDPVLPRYEVQIGPITGNPIALDRAEMVSLIIQITVVVGAGDYSERSLSMVEKIVDHFAPGTRIGSAEVQQRPEVAPSFAEGAAGNASAMERGVSYRVPITIRLRTFL